MPVHYNSKHSSLIKSELFLRIICFAFSEILQFTTDWFFIQSLEAINVFQVLAKETQRLQEQKISVFIAPEIDKIVKLKLSDSFHQSSM